MRPPEKNPPYISNWVARDDTWVTTGDTDNEEGRPVPVGTTVELLEGACDRVHRHPAISHDGSVVIICTTNARPTDSGEWSVREHRTPLGAVKPGEPFRQPGVGDPVTDLRFYL